MIDEVDKIIADADDIRKKKLEIEKYRVNASYSETIENQKILDDYSNLNITFGSNSYIEKIQSDLVSYSTEIKKAPVFLNDSFRGAVPYCKRQLFLLGARTGEGKSTVAANLALQTIRQENQKCYIITNEESTDDVFNRITSLIHGWPYTDHENIPKERWDVYERFIKILATRLVVIDDNYNNKLGLTTSVEGVKSILDSIKASGEKPGAIIIDYYQNITQSHSNPSLDRYKVQAKVANLLNGYKNIMDSPIILLSQLYPESKEKSDFQSRIVGTKEIIQRSTVAIEVKANKDALATDFIICKNRFSEFANHTIRCGYDKGRYVKYTPEFANNVEKMKSNKATQALIKHSMGDAGK